MTNKMNIYNSGCEVPKEALKTIGFGRLKGKSSIDPMWRIKKMTEIFGSKGEGWKTKKVKEDFYKNEKTGETLYTIEIDLFYKMLNDEGKYIWSEAVEGVGSHYMFKVEKHNIVFNDEFKKMARTDAEGNAMKSLGIGGNVYMGLCDGDKYQHDTDKLETSSNEYIGSKEQKLIYAKIMNTSFIMKDKVNGYKILTNITKQTKSDYTTKPQLNKFIEYIEKIEKQDIQFLKTNLINKLTKEITDKNKIMNHIKKTLNLNNSIKVSDMDKLQIALIDTSL